MSELDRPRLALLVALGLIVCLLGARYLRTQPAAPAGGQVAASTNPGTTSGVAPAGGSAATGSATVRLDRAGATRLIVHVAGAVRNPGVYRFAAGARVDDAVRRAGGATRRADLSAVNLAAKLEDGRQVLVPQRAAALPATGPAAAAGPGAAGAAGAGGGAAGAGAGPPAAPINLNAATLEQLDTLDGVGPGIAQRIIDYREQHGGFRSVAELGEVPGIGDKRLAALTPRVTV